MTFAGMSTRAEFVAVLALIALIVALAAACSEDSVQDEAPPRESPSFSDATFIPSGDEGLMYAIENPVLECRDGASWVSIRQIGDLLGDDTVIKASPITPGRSEGEFLSVGGYQALDTMVTSSRRAADVIGERDYLDDTFMAATVEAELPAFLTDSNYAQFSVVLTGTDVESGERFISNGLNLEMAAGARGWRREIG